MIEKGLNYADSTIKGMTDFFETRADPQEGGGSSTDAKKKRKRRAS